MIVEVTPSADGKFTALVKSNRNLDYAIRGGFSTNESAFAWGRKVAHKIEWNIQNLQQRGKTHAQDTDGSRAIQAKASYWVSD